MPPHLTFARNKPKDLPLITTTQNKKMSKKVTETRNESTGETIRTTVEDKPGGFFSEPETVTTVEKVTPGFIFDSTEVISRTTTKKYD